jgi:hypothetical protein
MSKDHRRAWMAWSVAAAIALISVTGVVVSRAESPPGCDVVAPGSIVESAHFTPVEGTLTEPPDPPITMVGQPDTAVPADASVESIDGLPRRWAVISENGAAYQYFFTTELPVSLTVSEFYAAGGVQLDRDPVDNGESFAIYVLDSLGSRATRIEIGKHIGALVWADPLTNGVRPHYLYWSDGAWNYALMAKRPPVSLVNLARALVCGEDLAGRQPDWTERQGFSARQTFVQRKTSRRSHSRPRP